MPFSVSRDFHTALPHSISTKTNYFLPTCTSVSTGHSQIQQLPPFHSSMESKHFYIEWDL